MRRGNGQRLITIADIPAETRIAARAEGNAVSDVRAGGKTIAYDATWLPAHAYDHDRRARPAGPPRKSRSGMPASRRIPIASFNAVSSDRGGWAMAVRRPPLRLRQADRTGRSKAARCSASPRCSAMSGRRITAGISRCAPRSTRPTSPIPGLGLQAHTDNPYRDPVPTLQILYCLENSAQGRREHGGRRLSRGGAAARRESPRLRAADAATAPASNMPAAPVSASGRAAR